MIGTPVDLEELTSKLAFIDNLHMYILFNIFIWMHDEALTHRKGYKVRFSLKKNQDAWYQVMSDHRAIIYSLVNLLSLPCSANQECKGRSNNELGRLPTFFFSSLSKPAQSFSSIFLLSASVYITRYVQLQRCVYIYRRM